MLVMKAYKTELDPNNKQKTAFRRFAGTARFVYNWALANRKLRFEKGEKTSLYSQRKHFNSIKRDQCPWVTEIPYAVTESAFANCDAAFKHFFRRVKNGDEKPGYPRFKHRGAYKSFQLRNVRVKDDCIVMTGIGRVRLKELGYIPTDADYGTYFTVSERADRWFVSILVKGEQEVPNNGSGIIGVDLGIKTLATCSDGTTFDNPKCLENAQRKLNRLQRELSRRRKGGSNWKKTKAKIAKVHFKVANIRSHTLHQISHYLTEVMRPSVIVLENLNISGMVKNRRLARAVSDVGFSELRRQIEYKAKFCGISVVFADRFFPSSKTCSACGIVKKDLSLSDRIFDCPNCGASLDRDLNAAHNLAALVNRESHGDCLLS